MSYCEKALVLTNHSSKRKLAINTNKKTMIYLSLASALVMGSAQVQAQTGNTAYGTEALLNNTTGDYNSAFGEASLKFNTSGYQNTASGFRALYKNTTGYHNTASGHDSPVGFITWSRRWRTSPYPTTLSWPAYTAADRSPTRSTTGPSTPDSGLPSSPAARAPRGATPATSPDGYRSTSPST